MTKTLLTVAILALAISFPCFAGNNPSFKVAVHVLPRDCDRNCAFGMPDIDNACDVYPSFEGPGEFEFFPVFYDLIELKCLEYSVTWTGAYPCAFTSCSYTHIGTILWSGDWIAQCYKTCQQGPVVIPGWGWLEMNKPGRICVTPVSYTHEIGVLDCTGDNIDNPVAVYCAGVMGASGDDPCRGLVRGIEPTTWGQVKSIFR